ncbi:MAG TPA: hypothetical protein VGB24_15525 [Longimicrobium sp.]|jgi:hypothetical protein|uniref:hypothetical protein n=1 Tax=Longimicrobium sp. TaxID=2029185 RepID=UPI002ED9D783
MLKVETRSALILLCTLLLGAALGGVGTGALVQYRASRVEKMRRPGGFSAHMHEIIQPHSAAQWDSLLPIVQVTAGRNERIQARTRVQMKAALDSMRRELAPLLDEAQRRRLEAFARTARPPKGHGHGGRPPPPEGAPWPPPGEGPP